MFLTTLSSAHHPALDGATFSVVAAAKNAAAHTHPLQWLNTSLIWILLFAG
jgi:hypothetical protein